MTLTEKAFALRAVPPFDRLNDSELALVAEATKFRLFAPGERIASADGVLQKLYVRISGAVFSGNEHFPAVFGAPSLLFGHSLERDLIACPETGASCLLISKGHFFTLIYECPCLMVGFFTSPDCSRS
ncbi:MAG TPA: Crp/Fnr family transcriptional regulator [Cyanobacteria bacterium UBA8530]|nr:Crp/Fnr family transcriptional regulator [Cyanobacteria bacterium UBA8530]